MSEELKTLIRDKSETIPDMKEVHDNVGECVYQKTVLFHLQSFCFELARHLELLIDDDRGELKEFKRATDKFLDTSFADSIEEAHYECGRVRYLLNKITVSEDETEIDASFIRSIRKPLYTIAERVEGIYVKLREEIVYCELKTKSVFFYNAILDCFYTFLNTTYPQSDLVLREIGTEIAKKEREELSIE